MLPSVPQPLSLNRPHPLLRFPEICRPGSLHSFPFFPIALSAAKLDGSDISKPVTGKSGAYIALTLLKQSTDRDDLDLTALYGAWLNDGPLTRDAALELIHRTAELSKTLE